MVNRCADGPSEAGQRAYLVETIFENLLPCACQLLAPKVSSVGEARMSADVDAELRRGHESCMGRLRAACVKPAGNVRGSDKRHKLGIVRATLAEIAIKIDFHLIAWVEKP